jgi:integrase/recombinase XerD
MVEGAADIRFIQQMLGHAEISTAQIYTQVVVKALQEVYQRSHPAAKLERKHRAEGSAGDELAEEKTRQELLAVLEAEAAEEEDE